jgi:hypothetical protein
MRDKSPVVFKKCIYCDTVTRLHIDGVPVCFSCAKEVQAGRTPPYREPDTSPTIPRQASS